MKPVPTPIQRTKAGKSTFDHANTGGYIKYPIILSHKIEPPVRRRSIIAIPSSFHGTFSPVTLSALRRK